MRRASWQRIVLLILATLVAGTGVTHARGGSSRDPFARWQAHKRQTELRKSKRREQLDSEGATERDAKKSAEDSREYEQLQHFGPPNDQRERWSPF